MKTLLALLDGLSTLLKWVGGAALTAMMLLTVADVGGRFFKHPIFGSVELVGLLAVVVTAAALPYTHKADGHVGVEIMVHRLSPKGRLFLDLVTRSLSLALFGIIAWQMFSYANDMKLSGEVSMDLEFPLYTIIYLLALGLLAFAATLLESLILTLKELKEVQ